MRRATKIFVASRRNVGRCDHEEVTTNNLDSAISSFEKSTPSAEGIRRVMIKLWHREAPGDV